MNFERQVEEFARLSVEFCRWAESPPGTMREEHFTATRFIARLYLAGLELPQADFNRDHDWEVTDDQCMKILIRFDSLPFRYYWEVYQPVADPPDNPVAGDIREDLADIYRDIKNGLIIWNNGHIADAVFHWKNTFSFHWGDHATSALRALHKYEWEDE